MMIEGGWMGSIDLGVDVGAENFLKHWMKIQNAIIGCRIADYYNGNMKKIVTVNQGKVFSSKILVASPLLHGNIVKKIGAEFLFPPRGGIAGAGKIY